MKLRRGDGRPPAAALLPVRGAAPEPFGCPLEDHPQAVVVRPSGEIDLATRPLLHAALTAAVERGRHVVVDLSDVTYLDGAGFHVLLVHQRLCARRRRILAVVNARRTVRKVIDILNADQALAVFSSMEEVLGSLEDFGCPTGE